MGFRKIKASDLVVGAVLYPRKRYIKLEPKQVEPRIVSTVDAELVDSFGKGQIECEHITGAYCDLFSFDYVQENFKIKV